MPSIRVHHSETTDKRWDGTANETRLKGDQKESYYRKAFAWFDEDGDPKTKQAYKFIHHTVDAKAKVGPASVRAASSRIGVLNGARRGTTIPKKDREGVYRHLAAHLKDAGETPPDLE